MSANRYSECPKCKKKNAAAVDEVRALYGKVPLEEFEQQLKAAKIVIDNDEESESTMREDWEIYIDGDYLVFSYGSCCAACNLVFSVRKKFKMI